jgi:hypothetical protein
MLFILGQVSHLFITKMKENITMTEQLIAVREPGVVKAHM